MTERIRYTNLVALLRNLWALRYTTNDPETWYPTCDVIKEFLSSCGIKIMYENKAKDIFFSGCVDLDYPTDEGRAFVKKNVQINSSLRLETGLSMAETLSVKDLHDQLLNKFGPKCKEYTPGCATCWVWEIFSEMKFSIRV